MRLPRKLQNMNLFSEAESFIGEVGTVTLPKLTRKTDEWRGGGMNAPVEAAMGMEVLTCDHSYGGYMLPLIKQFGITDVDGVGLRFRGAYQRGDSGAVDAVEIVMRGFHKEIDRGDSKPGDDTDFKVVSSLSYYKEIVNGLTVVEIDVLNMIEIIDGVDRLADQRTALGA